MKFDRNTVLGFVILAALFFGYFYFTNKQQSESRKEKAEKLAQEQRIKDSIDRINKPLQDSLNKITDSAAQKNLAGIFQDTVIATEQLVTLQNELIIVTFSSKGGQPKKVELKNYKGQDSNLVKLASTDFDKISYAINTGTVANGGSAQTSDLFFSKVDSSSKDGNKIISFTRQSSDSGAYIIHEYILKPNDYQIDFNVKMGRADKILQGGTMNLSWQYAAAQQESDITFEKQNTQVGYVEDGSFDYHTISRKSSKNFDESVSWVGVRQRFFFSSLVAKNNFISGRMEWNDELHDSAKMIVQSTANMKLQVPAGSPSVIPFSIYYGPSDYHILKKYDMKFEKLVNLGQGIYSFVRPINKYLILPIFDFLKSFAGGMGLAIALLTIFIKLITSPLLYKSYLSGAKMRVLRPEIAKLKEKHGNDRQAMSMDQMKIFKEAGVNPLGGCLPALLQIPIFFALFSLFSADVGLRGAEFLWANDLAAYDAPIKFGFHIPLLGSHLSLFNIAAVVTSFLISIYSMSMTPDQK